MTTTAELLADDPLWLILLKVVGIFAFLVLMTLFSIWAERRVLGRMQHRPGPNRAAPFGLLQSLAEALKLAYQVDIRPLLSEELWYFLSTFTAASLASACNVTFTYSLTEVVPRPTV